MSYVQRVLQPGEQVRYTAALHWIVAWPGLLFLLGAIVMFVLARIYGSASGFWLYLGGVLLVVALIFLFREWFEWWITEIAVTDRRVIFKKGFIRRKTNEMNMEKVESVKVDQPILGRILNFGHVTVVGTGEGETELHFIAKPIELRNHITGV